MGYCLFFVKKHRDLSNSQISVASVCTEAPKKPLSQNPKNNSNKNVLQCLYAPVHEVAPKISIRSEISFQCSHMPTCVSYNAL